jgi:hypothetical protein
MPDVPDLMRPTRLAIAPERWAIAWGRIVAGEGFIRPTSRIEVGDQLAFEPRDLVLEHELAPLQALHLQLVDFEIHAEARNDVIEVAMLDAQLAQAFDVLEQIGIDFVVFVVHGVTYFT